MSPGEWIGSNISSFNRTLILGESHYEDKNGTKAGEQVDFPTSSVVERYLSHISGKTPGEHWDRFFTRIAESFGYSKESAEAFYNKVFFGNYVPVFCGIGENNTAIAFMSANRTEYNNQLFDFLNEKEIDTVVCFSKDAYWNLPSLAENEKEFTHDFVLGEIGRGRNIVNYCKYMPDTIHPACDIKLNKTVQVYGIRHPSCGGGYNSQQVYKKLSLVEDGLRVLCKHT